MTGYLLRRILYMIPILIGINFLTFALFFVINSPDQLARFNLGEKHVTPQAIENWKVEHGYDKPLLYNPKANSIAKVTNTIFFEKSLKLFAFNFGSSDAGRDIGHDISQRMWPSLYIAVPTLLLGLALNIMLALFIVFFRHTYLETLSLVVCIVFMSISALFYIIGGQYIFANLFKLVPISGYVPGWGSLRFLLLPIAVSVVGGFGSGIRWYRTLFMEEINKDYVRTVRAKGMRETVVLFKHVLRNAMIPILTGLVVVLPLLFLGSLLTESFFGIPGLGSYTIDAIQQQDFAIVRSMVFLGSFLYVIGLLLTDIAYAWADPRVRFN